jgi:hypothetical protein
MTARPSLRPSLAFALVVSLSVLPLGAAAKPAAKEKAPAKGGSFFRFDKVKSTFAHACGFRVRGDHRDIERLVVLSSVPIDCAAADKAIDPREALEEVITEKKGAFVAMTVSADGERIGGSWRSKIGRAHV